MHRFKTSQRLLLTSVFLLGLLTFDCSIGTSGQKIDFDSLELDREIEPASSAVSIIAKIKPITVIQGGQLIVRIIGRTDRDHHLYSVKQQGEFAPNPTKIIVMDPLLTATSEMAESATLLIHDEAFDEPLQVHKNDFWISQQYQLNKNVKPGIYQISGYLLYQICDNRICSLPLKNHFREKITIKK